MFANFVFQFGIFEVNINLQFLTGRIVTLLKSVFTSR
jgi:hypothetical protein